MKPKNRVFCPDCGKPKMLFDSEKRAQNFLNFNGDDVNPDGTRTMRVYYCPSCCGYHISSHEYRGNSRTEKLISEYKKATNDEFLDKAKAKNLCWEMKLLKLSTKEEVLAYTNTKTEYTPRIIELARCLYYNETGITKRTRRQF